MKSRTKLPRLEALRSSVEFCTTPITSTYITTITRVVPSTTTFERYVTDSQKDRTTTITQTILEAIERTTTSQLLLPTIFCAPSSSLPISSNIPTGVDQSTNLSNISFFLPSPTSTTTAPTTSSTSSSAPPYLSSKTPAIIAAATIPIVVFIIVMLTFCFLRRRTTKKAVDLEHIAIKPETLIQPKPTSPASIAFGTTVVGEFIPEDSISFVQHTNPANPVDYSLGSTVAPSEVQQEFSRQSASTLYPQLVAPNTRTEYIHYYPVSSHRDKTGGSEAPRTLDDIHKPAPFRPLSVAISHNLEMTSQHPSTSGHCAAAINKSSDMVYQQPSASQRCPVAVDQLLDIANYHPDDAQLHSNLAEATMDISPPVIPISQTPSPSETAYQRAITDALRRLEGQSTTPRPTTGFDRCSSRHREARDSSLRTVQENFNYDSRPPVELSERLCGKAQSSMCRLNEEPKYRDGEESLAAAIQIRRAGDEEVRQMATHTGNLSNTAHTARQAEATKLGQIHQREALPPSTQKERGGASRKRPGGRDTGYTMDAAEAISQRSTTEDKRAGIEMRERQRQLQMHSYGGLPQEAYKVRGTRDGQRLNTRSRPPLMDDYNAFLEAARERERADRQGGEFREEIARDHMQRKAGQHRMRVRGEGVTDIWLMDFDVDAVNRQSANQPPRSRKIGILDSGQSMPLTMPKANLPDSPPSAFMRRSDREKGQRIHDGRVWLDRRPIRGSMREAEGTLNVMKNCQ